MLHIIANPFNLTQFLLDSLPPQWQGSIHLHPPRHKGLGYTVRKALDAALPCRFPGLRSFSDADLQGLLAIAPHASVLIFGIENLKDLRTIRKHLRTRNVFVSTWNRAMDHSQSHRARCLLEWTQAKQTGLTIRSLEALFFDKKLITNNPWVKQQAFYHPARAFILGQEDLEQITDFLAAPMLPIANDEPTRHDFAHWVRQFETPCTP